MDKSDLKPNIVKEDKDAYDQSLDSVKKSLGVVRRRRLQVTSKEEDDLHTLLTKTDDSFSTVTGNPHVLSFLIRQIIDRKRIFNLQSWQVLMDRYLNDPSNNIPNNKIDQSTARGNLTKELCKRRMTWKSFLKGLKFFGFIKFELTLKLYDEIGNTEIFKVTKNLQGYSGENDPLSLSLEDDDV